jgi:predicted RNA-binding Zn-ribbon protein involved in translation (DUF1610 family)
MNMMIEYGCGNCGNRIFRIDPLPLHPSRTIDAANKCDECGFLTDIFHAARFQWVPQLRSTVGRLCTHAEMKELRRDPSNFVLSTLNAKLAAAERHGVEIDSTSTPMTIREKA